MNTNKLTEICGEICAELHEAETECKRHSTHATRLGDGPLFHDFDLWRERLADARNAVSLVGEEIVAKKDT